MVGRWLAQYYMNASNFEKHIGTYQIGLQHGAVVLVLRQPWASIREWYSGMGERKEPPTAPQRPKQGGRDPGGGMHSLTANPSDDIRRHHDDIRRHHQV